MKATPMPTAPAKPTIHGGLDFGSSTSGKTSTAKGKAKDGKQKPPPDFDAPLSMAEREGLAIALVELSKMADGGVWHLGTDTDPDVPDIHGDPGVPIFTMTMEESEVVVKALMQIGSKRTEVLKAARALIEAHTNLQAGMILGSRFWEFGVRLFHQGLNFRGSKLEWTREVGRKLGEQHARAAGAGQEPH